MSKNVKPYYAVIFTNELVDNNDQSYYKMAEAMENLAKEQDGFLGIDSVRNDRGITVSYWENLDAIKSWKENVTHQAAQEMGKEKWYSSYKVRIAKVEREYDFKRM